MSYKVTDGEVDFNTPRTTCQKSNTQFKKQQDAAFPNCPLSGDYLHFHPREWKEECWAETQHRDVLSLARETSSIL